MRYDYDEGFIDGVVAADNDYAALVELAQRLYALCEQYPPTWYSGALSLQFRDALEAAKILVPIVVGVAK